MLVLDFIKFLIDFNRSFEFFVIDNFLEFLLITEVKVFLLVYGQVRWITGPVSLLPRYKWLFNELYLIS